MIPNVAFRPGLRGLHRVHPGTNLLLLASALFAVLGTHSLVVKGAVLLLTFALAAWSEGSIRSWSKALRFVATFSLLLFVAQVLSVREGLVLFRLGIPVTRDGVVSGANMALRFLVILSSSFTFVVTTDPDALANALIQWGIPYRHGYTLILALRFVPFFRNELRIVRDAQRMRGIKASVRSVRSIGRSIRYTFVPVLVAGLIRVDTIAMSMKGRAFGLYRRRTPPPRARLVWEDILVWGCSAGCIGVAVWAGGAGWL